MRQTKRIIPVYALYDRTNIQKLLEKQAQQGWMPETLGNYLWKFKRIEPKMIHFAVTYFPEATFYDPEPSEKQRTLQEFCNHAGWVLGDSQGPMQVFYNENEDPLPIETDPVVELENIHKTVKKTYLNSYWLLLVVWLLNLAMRLFDVFQTPLSFFGSNLSLFNLSNCLALVVMCLVEIMGYYHWHRKAERAAIESGEFIKTRNFKWVELVILGVMLLELEFLLTTMESLLAQTMGIMFGEILCVIVIGQCLIRLMKRFKFSAGTNKLVSMVTVSLLTIVVIGGTTAYMMTREIPAEPGVETYEFRGSTFEIHHDDLPLTVKDLIEPDYDRYSYELSRENSIFMTTQNAVQSSRMGETAATIRYDIYDIHLPAIFEVCFQDILHSYDKFNNFDDAGNITNDSYQAVDAALWGADAAYCRYSGGLPTNKFLLRYDQRIVEITFDWQPTPEQMAIVGQSLEN